MLTIRFLTLLIFATLAAACAAPPPLSPTALPAPTADPLFLSDGRGDPRTPGYWLLWNACAPDNRAETARANGGRAAGWLLVDDLLQDPGILVGDLALATCEQAVRLLQRQPIAGSAAPDDAAYSLATELVAAQLNLAAAAESCPAAEQAVQAAQLLLISVGFNGAGAYLPPAAAAADHDLALSLAALLTDYNSGALCR
jgi:hypothetical protein